MRWIGLALAASPAGLPLLIILRYGVNFYYWDEWDPDVVGIYIKAHRDQLTLADLVSPHNEHRILLPRLFYLLLNSFSQSNEILAMLVGWGLVCVTSLCVLYLIRRTADRQDSSAGFSVSWRWLLCNLLIFTMAQCENWLSAWGLTNAMPMAFIALGIVIAISRIDFWIRLPACLLLAAAASFSNACGFGAWPLVGVVLLWSTSPGTFRGKMPLIFAWGAGFAAIAGIYFYHLQSGPPADVYTPGASRFIFYLIAFPANAFAYGTGLPWETVCFAIGSILYLLFLASLYQFFAAWRSKRFEYCQRLLVWLTVAGFSMLNAVMGAMTRSGFGYEQVKISRYVTFGIYLPVALINLVPMVCEDLNRRHPSRGVWNQIPRFFEAAMVVLVLLSLPLALNSAQTTQSRRLAGKAALLLIDLVPDNPQLAPLVYQHVDRLAQEADALNGMGYLQPPLIGSSDASLIARQNGGDGRDVSGAMIGLVRDSAGQLYARGWAFSPQLGRAADGVFITYQDAAGHPIIFAAARMRVQLDELAGKLPPEELRDSGWQAVLDLRRIPASLHTTQLEAWALDAETARATPLDGMVNIQR